MNWSGCAARADEAKRQPLPFKPALSFKGYQPENGAPLSPLPATCAEADVMQGVCADPHVMRAGAANNAGAKASKANAANSKKRCVHTRSLLGSAGCPWLRSNAQ